MQPPRTRVALLAPLTLLALLAFSISLADIDGLAVLDGDHLRVEEVGHLAEV